MAIRFGINGFGRIGRALTRIAFERRELGIELVQINDPATPGQLARLLAHDTVHGRFPAAVGALEQGVEIAGRKIGLTGAATPAAVDWSIGTPVVVVESTGRFRRREAAAGHLGRSVERVLISATTADADATFCMGINERTFDPGRHHVVSNASCTTNALAAVLAALHPAFGVERALMNTVHCVTNSQNLVDMAHTDPRRARSALANIIPTSSDAFPSIDWVLPELRGRISGLAMRVPIAAGSLIDLTVELRQATDREALASAFRAAERGPLAGVLGTTDEELVSSDFIGDPRSAVVDLGLLQSAGDRLHRIVAWYDNEWGYANRLAELVARLAT
ncbi:MAG: type I glyceraldehyde-3-phosphate dehydrogenase [Thermoanaerobaculia bacterium]